MSPEVSLAILVCSLGFAANELSKLDGPIAELAASFAGYLIVVVVVLLFGAILTA